MKIYFIAICGKGGGNLAVFLKKQGHEVYGSEYSEKTFYPPIADIIKDNNIPVDFGFDPQKITNEYDLIIVGGAAFIHDPKNPQIAKAKELGLKMMSFANGIGEFIAKEEAIEVVGNHGKTTTTSIIAWMLKYAGEDASYFIGEAPLGFEFSVYSGESKWSVSEGDEHPTLNVENGGKFLYHKAKHILFTSADWDHKNIYKTEKSYLEAFQELFAIQPPEGRTIACLDGKKIFNVLSKSKVKTPLSFYTIGKFKELKTPMTEDQIDEDILISLSNYKVENEVIMQKSDYLYYIGEVDYKWRPDSTRFLVKRINISSSEVDKIGYFETQLIGQIGLENSLAALSTLLTLGFASSKLKEGLAQFKGAKRRLELILNREYKVINDYAHSPIKIAASLKAIRTKYYDNRVFVIFHANQSGLQVKNTFNDLKKAFNLADYVLIPRVIPDINSTDHFFGKDFRDLIKEGAQSEDNFLKSSNVYYTPLGVQMQSVLENNLKLNDIVLIMSSGDTRELIELTKGLRISQ